MNDPKEVRKQLRRLMVEVLPEVLKDALVEAVQNKVMTDAQLRLKKIEQEVKTTLEALDKRQQETLGYLVRQVSTAAPNILDNPAPPAKLIEGEQKDESQTQGERQ